MSTIQNRNKTLALAGDEKHMPKKKATKKKPCCPTCGGEMAPPAFELPGDYLYYTVFVLREDKWKIVRSFGTEDAAVKFAVSPGLHSEWLVVYSNLAGKVAWGPQWVPGGDE